MTEAAPEHPALIIYDGECVFCCNYVRLLRLRETVGRVELINARSGDPRVRQYQNQGYDFDRGMLFAWHGRVYFGGDALHRMAALSTPMSWFNRCNAVLFASAGVSRLLYPLLNFGRLVTLAVRGKGRIRPHGR